MSAFERKRNSPSAVTLYEHRAIDLPDLAEALEDVEVRLEARGASRPDAKFDGFVRLRVNSQGQYKLTINMRRSK